MAVSERVVGTERKATDRFFDRLIRELRIDSMTNRKVIQDRMVRHWLREERPEDWVPVQPLTKR